MERCLRKRLRGRLHQLQEAYCLFHSSPFCLKQVDIALVFDVASRRQPQPPCTRTSRSRVVLASRMAPVRLTRGLTHTTPRLVSRLRDSASGAAKLEIDRCMAHSRVHVLVRHPTRTAVLKGERQQVTHRSCGGVLAWAGIDKSHRRIRPVVTTRCPGRGEPIFCPPCRHQQRTGLDVIAGPRREMCSVAAVPAPTQSVSALEVDKKLAQKAGVRPPLQQGDEFLLAANADSAASD
jgi:hypothetical protein